MDAARLYQKATEMNGLALLADAAAQAQDLSIFHPASPAAASIRSLFILVLAITGAIFLVVEGVLIFSIIRFRRRVSATTEPPQVYGSIPIEIAWTAAPMLIVFVLALILTRTEFEVRVNPDRPPRGSKPLHGDFRHWNNGRGLRSSAGSLRGRLFRDLSIRRRLRGGVGCGASGTGYFA